MSRVDRPSLTVLLSAALIVGACTAAAPGQTDSGPSPTAEPTPVATPTTAAATPTTAAPTGAATAPSTPAAPTATVPAATTPAASPAGAILDVATSTEHGEYLAIEGRALYIFTPDPQGSSTCYDTCAENWPPLLAPVAAGAGVDGEIGDFERTNDEGRQVTYNGAPLYFFVADTAAGQTNGEGVGDAWFLARPSPASSPGGGSSDEGDAGYDYEY